MATQGHGHGRGRGRGPEIYQAQTPNLPPAVAELHRPNGNPPNDLHFADDPYGQEAFLPEPPFWVTGYSHDSHPPIDANQAYKYEYSPKPSYEDNNNQDYDYYGEEEE